MRGADDGVLVLVGFAGVAGECFGEPVGRADEGRFGVEVLLWVRESDGRCGRCEKEAKKGVTIARCCWPVP